MGIWGTFYWNLMLFGIQNARATYQRAIPIIFHDMMHKNMEDCVHDTLTKLRLRTKHIDMT